MQMQHNKHTAKNSVSPAIHVQQTKYSRLKYYNIILGCLHLGLFLFMKIICVCSIKTSAKIVKPLTIVET